jgi:hypothetical protein
VKEENVNTATVQIAAKIVKKKRLFIDAGFEGYKIAYQILRTENAAFQDKEKGELIQFVRLQPRRSPA